MTSHKDSRGSSVFSIVLCRVTAQSIRYLVWSSTCFSSSFIWFASVAYGDRLRPHFYFSISPSYLGIESEALIYAKG